MPSKSRQLLDVVLEDVNAQLRHAHSFSSGGRGAPPSAAGVKRPGRPFTRAATVLLAGAVEGYVEGVVLETGVALNLSPQQLSDLKRQVGLTHGANVHHVHQLTAQIGLPFVLDQVTWRRARPGVARSVLSDLSERRNRIAHGRAPTGAQLREVYFWRDSVVRIADVLDRLCADAVVRATGTAPW